MVIRTIAYAVFLASTALAQSAPHNEPLAERSYHPTGKLIYMPVEINDASFVFRAFLSILFNPQPNPQQSTKSEVLYDLRGVWQSPRSCKLL